MTYIIKSKNHQTKHSQGIALLSILIISAILALGLVYLIQTNVLVKQSYQIRKAKEYLGELKALNQELQVEIALSQLPSNLEERVKNLNLVEGGEIVYLAQKEMAAK